MAGWDRPEDLAARLKDFREQVLGMDQAPFAEWAGVNPTQPSAWETGSSRPTTRKLEWMARKAGIPVSGFQGGQPMPSASVNRPVNGGRRGEATRLAAQAREAPTGAQGPPFATAARAMLEVMRRQIDALETLLLGTGPGARTMDGLVRDITGAGFTPGEAEGVVREHEARGPGEQPPRAAG